jgi:chromatin structure-remodeling complex subunit RSC9
MAPLARSNVESSGLRQQPTPRTFFAPDTTPSRAPNSRSTSQTQQTPQHQSHQQYQQQQPVTNGTHAPPQIPPVGTAPHYPDFKPSANTLPVLRPVLTPRNAPGAFQQNVRKRKLPELNGMMVPQGPRLGSMNPQPLLHAHHNLKRNPAGGHQGCSLMHRIQMSLKSGIPGDVEYALVSLVRVTFDAGDELLAAYWPALIDTLFEKIREMMRYVSDNVNSDMVDDSEFTKQLEMLNDCLLVIRNMSLQPDNAKRFATVNNPKDILTEGLTLPAISKLAEIKNYLLDMTECMAAFLPYSVNDPLLDAIVDGLESPDRGTLIGSMKALCRLTMGRDDYNRLGEIPMSTIQRLTGMLMLEDDELVSACLDFLYQYTTNEENIKKLLAAEGFELIRHLVRLLLFQGITGEQLVYIKMVKKAPPRVHEIPNLPEEIVQDLLTFPEPDRATKW